jgi:MFS family permease
MLYYGFSSLVLPMMADLGWSQTTLMGAFSLALAVGGVCTYGAGAIIDRGHGRRLMTAGALLAAVSLGLWAMATQVWMLYLAFALCGVAMSMTLYEPAFAILTRRYPQKYRDAIMALTLVAGFASTVSFPATAWLVAHVGWRGALWAMAAVFVILIAPMNAWALRGPKWVAAPIGHDETEDSTLYQALRHSTFWLLTAAFTLHAFVGAGLWAHVIPAFDGLGVAASDTLAVVVWIGPAQVTGRFLYALLGRGLSLRHLGVGVMCGFPLALSLLVWDHHVGSLVGFALLFGLSNGLVTIVRGGIVPETFGRSHIGRIGGLMSGISLVARSAAPVTMASLLLGLGHYRDVLWCLVGLSGVAVVAFVMSSGRSRRLNPENS